MEFKNPVLRGMYPDPSMCAANGKYYMVCSTFQYFPGIPLFESSDLINWHQIGHCLTRKSQLELEDGAGTSSGIYAPTIRYNKGRFYVVTTNVSNIGNFYVYTDDIYGEWSDPIKVEQDGIDPSLFFDDDGEVYFISNGGDKEGRACIQMSRIDIDTGKKLSENEPLWYGTGGRYIEAPHMYKFGDYYYILNAEGGTEYGHMVNYARSKNIRGPFEAFPGNPVLTNRNLGGYQLQGAGHGDVVQAADGTWWFCHLAFRQTDKYMTFHHLGRETCMEPVTWNDGWFYIGTNGTARLETACPDSHKFEKQTLSYEKTFANLRPECDFEYLRNPYPENYKISTSGLELTGTCVTLEGKRSPTWVGVRQCEFTEQTDCTVKLEGGSAGRKEAGISVYMDAAHHYDVYLEERAGVYSVSLRLRIGPANVVQKTMSVPASEAEFRIHAEPYRYMFYVKSGGMYILLGDAETRYLSSEVACGFTGVFTSFYAVDQDMTHFRALFTNLRITHNED